MLHWYLRRSTSFAIGLAVVLCASACAERNDALPPELLKVWRTSAPAYKHRYIEIRRDFLIFGTGEYSISMHPIERVEAINAGGNSADYLIEYSDNDREIYRIRLNYTGGKRPKLRLANHEEVWIPEQPPTGGA